MAQFEEIHSFEQGMNKDIAPLYLPNTSYEDAKNITISFDEGSQVLALNNIKGNKKLFSLPYLSTDATTLSVLNRADDSTNQTFLFSELEISKAEVDSNSFNFRIVGYTTLDTILVLLTRPKTDVNGMSIIWTVDLNNLSNEPVLVYIGKLNLPLSSIDVESHIESQTIKKIYWADGVNSLGHFNIADSDGYKLNADQLYSVSNVDLKELTITSIGNTGNFLAGAVQYIYQYYNEYGTESSISPPTPLIYLANEVDKGNEVDSIVTKTVNLNLVGDLNWDKIRIYRIHYTDSTTSPNLSLIADRTVSNTIVLSDDGNLNVSSQVVSDLLQNFILTSIVPSNIKSIENRLVIAGYSENLYDFDYDTRAYRFPISQTTTEVDDINGTNFRIDSSDNYNITQENGVPVTPYAVPDTHDTINLDNAEQVFSGNMYQANSTTLGASGPNVSISFSTINRLLDDDSTNPLLVEKTDIATTVGATIETKKTFRRDEVYRLSAVFTDIKGRRSSPKWICDLRIPDNYNSNFITVSSGNIFATYIYPSVVFNNLPSDCASVQLHIVPRDSSANKTIISQGYIMPSQTNYEGDYDHIQTPAPRFRLLDPSKYEVFDEVDSSNNDFTSGDYVYLASADEWWLCNNDANNVSTLSNPDFTLQILPAGQVPDAVLSFFSGVDLFDVNHLDLDKTTNSTDFGKGSFGDYDRKLINFFSPEVSYNRSIEQFNSYYLQNVGAANLSLQGYAIDADTTLTTGSRENDNVDFQYSYFKQSSLVNYSNQTYAVNEIDDIVLLKEDEETNLDSKDYSHRIYLGASVSQKRSRAATALLINTTDFYKVSNPAVEYGTPIVNYKQPLLNQYGGLDYSARLNNSYIPVSISKDVTSGSATVLAEYGDTFIMDFNHISSIIRATESNTWGVSTIVYLETDINTSKRLSTDIANFDNINTNAVSAKNSWLQNNARDFESDGVSPRLYKQNTIYNKQSDITKTFVSVAVNTEFSATVRISELKFNNEFTDSWLKYLSNNFLDLEGKYGSINAIEEFNNNLIYFQNDAIGALSINPKYQVVTNEGNLIAGTGGILDDYNYITTTHGSKHRDSVVKSPKGLYYYDASSKKIRVLGDLKGAFSDVKGIHKYLQGNVASINSNPVQSDGISFGYSYKTNKVYFTFNGAATPFTLQYDETSEIIECFIDCMPLMWLNTRKSLLSNISYNDFSNDLTPDSLYEMGTGNYGAFFGELFDSYIVIVNNDQPQHSKQLTNIHWLSDVLESSTELTDTTFYKVQVYNNYQDTKDVELTSKYLHNQFRKWHLIVPRNVKHLGNFVELSIGSNNIVGGTLYKNPITGYFYKAENSQSAYTLPSDGSMDINLFSKNNTLLDRITNFYNFIKLSFKNQNDRSLNCYPITIVYSSNKGIY